MRKTLVIALCLLLTLGTLGCSYKVLSPMPYPNYTFDGEPTTDQLRQTAVRAMRDMLSIQWCTGKEITYKKNGPVSGKQFLHVPKTNYAGVLYSSASSGLFQFLEYYDRNTGELTYEGSADELKLDLGASCADSLLWAWSTVCNSFTGGFYPVLMVPSNGYLLVGDYTCRSEITSFNEMPSYAIIDNNPKEVMLEAYAQALPADALISTSKNHAMMVIQPAEVAYLDDGSIDPDNSYLTVQDQRGGSSSTTFYEEKVDGRTIYYSGRTSAKCSFAKLYEDAYIPVTAAEFTGADPYEKASVTVSGTAGSISELENVTVESNYIFAVINILVTDADGNKTVAKRTLFNGSMVQGPVKSYCLEEMDLADLFSSSDLNVPGNTVEVEVVVSTGERFIPISFEI